MSWPHSLDGYVYDPHVNQRLNVIDSRVRHNPDGSVTLTTDQLWMTTAGRFANRPLSDFDKLANPLNWDQCDSTKSFFVNMEEVAPPTAANHWPKTIDETVQLQPGLGTSEVTARLAFNFASNSMSVGCTYHLVTPGDMTEDHGDVEAKPLTVQLLNPDTHQRVTFTFFRVKSEKTIAFADHHQDPDAIVAMVWGWGADRIAECAGPANPAQAAKKPRKRATKR